VLSTLRIVASVVAINIAVHQCHKATNVRQSLVHGTRARVSVLQEHVKVVASTVVREPIDAHVHGPVVAPLVLPDLVEVPAEWDHVGPVDAGKSVFVRKI